LTAELHPLRFPPRQKSGFAANTAKLVLPTSGTSDWTQSCPDIERALGAFSPRLSLCDWWSARLSVGIRLSFLLPGSWKKEPCDLWKFDSGVRHTTSRLEEKEGSWKAPFSESPARNERTRNGRKKISKNWIVRYTSDLWFQNIKNKIETNPARDRQPFGWDLEQEIIGQI
jgi:hypothetical protein